MPPSLHTTLRPPVDQAGRKFRAGVVAIVGRPNTGKSTLLNRLVGMKVSIVSRRPQTTRHRILGIVTDEDSQAVFVDTPGFQTEHGGALNRLLNRAVTGSVEGVDAIILVVEAGRLTAQDKKVLGLLPAKSPVILALNKIDRLKQRKSVLPMIGETSRLFSFAEIVPVSALRGVGIDELHAVIKQYLPEGHALYGTESVTDRSERFLAAELIREKLFEMLGEELPYSTSVAIDRFEEEGRMRRIFASIIVAKDSQKAIVIGTRGEKLKRIATKARQDMEKMLGTRIYLEVWVRVKHGWADDLRSLRALGYE